MNAKWEQHDQKLFATVCEFLREAMSEGKKHADRDREVYRAFPDVPDRLVLEAIQKVELEADEAWWGLLEQRIDSEICWWPETANLNDKREQLKEEVLATVVLHLRQAIAQGKAGPDLDLEAERAFPDVPAWLLIDAVMAVEPFWQLPERKIDPEILRRALSSPQTVPADTRKAD